jgi:hypothetical protein
MNSAFIAVLHLKVTVRPSTWDMGSNMASTCSTEQDTLQEMASTGTCSTEQDTLQEMGSSPVVYLVQ